jgi:XTP/dITP diphosphohydrolase
MKLLVATSNTGKVREMAEVLGGLGLEVVDLDAAGVASLPAPDETGSTFQENALLKARYYYEAAGLLTVADDSGLEVAILGGRPGLYSSRYGDSDEDRIARLLGELDGVPSTERAARFVCALALVGENLAETFTGTCEGSIRHIPSGTNGFGFDPIFVPEGETRSFAEMTAAEKAAVSHRGRAIAGLVEFIRGR